MRERPNPTLQPLVSILNTWKAKAQSRRIRTLTLMFSSLRWISFSRFCSATVSLLSIFESVSVLRLSWTCFTSTWRPLCSDIKQTFKRPKSQHPLQRNDNYNSLGGLQLSLDLFLPILLGRGEFSLYQRRKFGLTHFLDGLHRLLDLDGLRVLIRDWKKSMPANCALNYCKCIERKRGRRDRRLTWFLSFSLCSCSICARLDWACSSFSCTVVSSCWILVVMLALTRCTCSSYWERQRERASENKRTKHGRVRREGRLLTCSRRRTSIFLMFSSRWAEAVFSFSSMAVRTSPVCCSRVCLVFSTFSMWSCAI